MCSTNTKRNSITTSLFKNYVKVTHPIDISGVDLIEVPNNVVVIESAIHDKINERYNASF